jgi:hypothetical protein
MMKFHLLPYNFSIRHSLSDIRYSLFVKCMIPTHFGYWLNSCDKVGFYGSDSNGISKRGYSFQFR